MVGRFGGPLAATIVLKGLIALGVRRFISIGDAGYLQPACRFGEVVVFTGAIRGEGVSHHCVATDKFSYPSPALTGGVVVAVAAMNTDGWANAHQGADAVPLDLECPLLTRG